MLEYHIYSLMRSGHHAITNWFIQQLDCPYLYVNCINEPYRQLVHIDNNPQRIICTIEDERRPLLNFIPDGQWGFSSKSQDILVLRDPYNFLASRIRSFDVFPKNIQDMQSGETINKWKEHAKEFLRITRKLENVILVNYNQWVKNNSYRTDLAEQLKIKFTDRGFDEVANFGFGSSFDKLQYKQQAKKMRVLERYKQYLHDKLFIAQLDSELHELSDAIFHFRLDRKILF